MAVTYTFADRRSPVDASELDTNFSDLDTLKAPKASPTFTGTVTLSGGQIAFPATQNSSANANTLDDYEEGTFTPGISFGGGTTGITYGAAAGSYTKLGNFVSCSGIVSLSNKGSSTGSAAVTGLPFASKTGDGNYVAATLRFDAITYTGQFQGYLAPAGSTAIVLEAITEAGTNSARNDTHFANNSGIIFNVNYKTT